MQQTGYLHQEKRRSPTGLALVILAHAGVLGALALVKGPQFILPDERIIVTPIPIPEEPPVEPQPQPPEVEQRPREQLTAPERPLPPLPTDGPVTPDRPLPPLPSSFASAGDGTIATRPLPDRSVPLPVRRAAEFDPRHGDALQPPYPPSEERAQRNGLVRLRVTIGTNGRVLAVARLQATSEAFWAATQRHALNRWRFRPATVDGRPVESDKILNVRFNIEDL